MSTPMAIAVYFTMWWIVLFAILPWGVRSQHESGDWQRGTDPGAPIAPIMAVRALATAILSAVSRPLPRLLFRPFCSLLSGPMSNMRPECLDPSATPV